MKHKKEMISVLIGVILIVLGAYLISKIPVKETVKKKVEKEELKVNGEVINLKVYRVDSLFFLKIPDSFTAVTGDALNQKYGTTERPELIFESSDDLTHISVTKGKDTLTDDMLNNYVASIKDKFTDAKVETYQKHDKNFVRLTGSSSDKYYDIRYFTLEDKLVTVEFYTTLNQKEDWEKVSKKILDNIYFDEDN